ncbi:hypothetical protein, partial [Paenibacillus sp. ICGEB2008]|uniref:hypothetical protein n=1 Tax=Paenibacillus sp. ICGEB2008 TaxID=996640 RepID=UPI00061A5228
VPNAGNKPHDGSRAEHEEDGDPPGSPGKTGVNPVFPETRDLVCKEKKTTSQKDGVSRQSELLFMQKNRRSTKERPNGRGETGRRAYGET